MDAWHAPPEPRGPPCLLTSPPLPGESDHASPASVQSVSPPAWSPVPTPFSALSTIHPALLGSSGVNCDPHWLGGLAMIYGHLLKSCLPHFCVHSIQHLAPKRELSQEVEQGPWRVTWQPAITLQSPSHLANPPPSVHPTTRNPTCAEGSVTHNCRRETESMSECNTGNTSKRALIINGSLSIN